MTWCAVHVTHLSWCDAWARVLQDELSGADIKAVCTEAGLLALRERRMRVTQVRVVHVVVDMPDLHVNVSH